MIRPGMLATLQAMLCCLLLSVEAGAADLVGWQSADSLNRLARSSHETDFFPLSNHFISQDNAIFCGPVSSAIVLNALRLGKRDDLPKDKASAAPATPNRFCSVRMKGTTRISGVKLLALWSVSCSLAA